MTLPDDRVQSDHTVDGSADTLPLTPSQEDEMGELWLHVEGEHGNKVRVFERTPGGTLYVAVWDPTIGGAGGLRKQSLRHTDKRQARAYARKLSGKLAEGLDEFAAHRLRLGRIIDLYLAEVTPDKKRPGQVRDQVRALFWKRQLGADKDPLKITPAEWKRITKRRLSGAVDANGLDVEPNRQRAVGPRTVGMDLLWLRYVLEWASEWSVDDRPLIARNPLTAKSKAFPVPKLPKPNRPKANDDRYDVTLAAARETQMRVRWFGRDTDVPSYLSAILVIAHDTGRRVGAIRQLRFRDLRLDSRPGSPHGAIQWPGETDKMGNEWSAPISQAVRQEIDRLRLSHGALAEWLFPAATDSTRAVPASTVNDMLERAEAKAKVPKLNGGLWHPYRRLWATARKHYPVADIAQAGGWNGTATLQQCYMDADDETVLNVVLNPAELREVR